jgi:hypothetical protein
MVFVLLVQVVLYILLMHVHVHITIVGKILLAAVMLVASIINHTNYLMLRTLSIDIQDHLTYISLQINVELELIHF